MSEDAQCCGKNKAGTWRAGVRGGRLGFHLGWAVRWCYLTQAEGSEGVGHTALGEELSGLEVEQVQGPKVGMGWA